MKAQNQSIRFMRSKAGDTVRLKATGAMPEPVHVFDEATVQAVDAALAAQRPLLVRGEPGIGKTQLARAVAKDLGRAYVQHVVDVRTESRDLMWRFDAVERLAEAQLRGALGDKTEAVRKRLSVENYLHPGPLWWAFDWQDAQVQAEKVGVQVPEQPDGGNPDNGCLVLVDEIDKAETDVPNGLLEALGAGTFTPEGRHAPIEAKGIAPLVIITTNEERGAARRLYSSLPGIAPELAETPGGEKGSD
jgi:MoxR-like ATPase